ncbi:poly-beta-1,6-N-acetyl-D-glucosamine N-deacetylase PgaB [Chromobacterium haemolyticum]|uniref:poly-beta-1,6-N-acetyl-D-glucosamine N-deacetylase PgaB n=1 Tax=Chromobacterium TaxID=535 RepID=UPI000B33000D|nr:poly-beta-1,6-N-acetyl-D-glucosamine N-deacetylase PgaB [Chromobacterium haemolyticum]
MKMKQWLAALMTACLLWSGWAQAAAGRLVILCYHEVDKTDSGASDPFAVDARALVKQMEWMRGQGYSFVSLQQVLDDRAGGKPLPDKAVLLTFDDGYRSVYTNVYPVLKLFQAPAVIALVGSWLEAPEGSQVSYGDGVAGRSKFLSWEQIREMRASGLVEVASHSYASHLGVLANPQGNLEPALTARAYRAGGYESESAYLARIQDDLRRNSALLKARLGVAPRAMVWPYGSYSPQAAKVAAKEGMPVTMGLGAGINDRDTPLSSLRRVLLDANMDLADLAYQFKQLNGWPDGIRPEPSRIMHVDLDYIYDPDPKRQDENLGRLLDRVKAMGVSTVYLQAFADPDGDGVAQALYFPNRHLPMRADLFNRAAWQLQTRANVRVYAWMPLLGFVLPAGHPLAGERVLAEQAGGAQAKTQGYARLTPYSPPVRQLIREIYEDLARSSRFGGLLFHDDATLSDFEDAGQAARLARQGQGLAAGVAEVRADPEQMARWTRAKTALLDDFSMELAAVVRQYQPDLRTARNLYAEVVLNPDSETWFAQSFDSALKRYDRVAVMAMPYMENAADPKAWMRRLFDKVAAKPGALEKTVFELQAVDWRSRKPIPTAELAATVRELNTLGARHIAYYPDDLFHDQPRLKAFRRVFSMTAHPEE